MTDLVLLDDDSDPHALTLLGVAEWPFLPLPSSGTVHLGCDSTVDVTELGQFLATGGIIHAHGFRLYVERSKRAEQRTHVEQCSVCQAPAHASETDDHGRCAGCQRKADIRALVRKRIAHDLREDLYGGEAIMKEVWEEMASDAEAAVAKRELEDIIDWLDPSVPLCTSRHGLYECHQSRGHHGLHGDAFTQWPDAAADGVIDIKDNAP